jgi:hypothetical protein
MKAVIATTMYLISFVAMATGAPAPINAYIANQIKTTANLSGPGTSLSTAGSGIVIDGIKTGKTLVIEGSTTNEANNVSTKGGSGSASANSAIQGIKTGNLGVGKGVVEIQSTSGATAGKNETSKVDTGSKSTLTVQVDGSKVTEIKTSVAQIAGTGRVNGVVNAGAAFSTVKTPALPFPSIVPPACPAI